ncbi:MAG: 3,4-dihydroxy-2-butanone-4-phosphate synthase [Methanosarcinales archaeon]|nr:3,4-dihydroxy-2-butanone-4-phosphate synthase [Methanosarcinales archaeon]
MRGDSRGLGDVLLALEALRQGRMVLLYDFDDREGETDLVMAAGSVTPGDVFHMRRDAGGLMCVAVDPLACSRLGIPYMSDVLRCACSSGQGQGCPEGFPAIRSIYERAGDIPYDSRSSFSLWVNHRRTYTGITDIDRAMTINSLERVTGQALAGVPVDFGAEFRSPGHVPLLRAAPGLLQERRGQTELSIVLARAAGITPAMVVCEMLDGETGRALSREDACRYGQERGLAWVEGLEVEELNRRMEAGELELWEMSCGKELREGAEGKERRETS